MKSYKYLLLTSHPYKLPNGNYIQTFEYGMSSGYPIYYRISSNPLQFNSQPNIKMVASSGASLVSSPYVVWTTYGGANGTIIIDCSTSGSIFINQALGEGEWREISTPQPGAYSRSLMILAQSQKQLLIMGAGYNQQSTINRVTDSVIDLSQLFGSSGGSTTTTSTITTTATTTTTGGSGGSGPYQTHWGQCGGAGWSGSTQCQSPYACQTQNPYYAQCV
jgi:hypothetical protein